MPISGSLLGIFFVVLGSVMLYNFRRNVAIETADFDFNTTEKQLEYKTFWERLRDSMMNAFGSQNNDDISHVSSISSRSVQHPTTSGIHYGSISWCFYPSVDKPNTYYVYLSDDKTALKKRRFSIAATFSS